MPTIGPFPPLHRISTIMSSKPPKNAFLPPSPLSPPAHPNRWKRPMKGTGRAAVQSNPGGGRRPCSGGEGEGKRKRTEGQGSGDKSTCSLPFLFAHIHTISIVLFLFLSSPLVSPPSCKATSRTKKTLVSSDDLQGGRIRRGKKNQ